MSARERLREAWAEWAPEWCDGRFHVGNVVIMTRSELSRTVREFRDLGRSDVIEEMATALGKSCRKKWTAENRDIKA